MKGAGFNIVLSFHRYSTVKSGLKTGPRDEQSSAAVCRRWLAKQWQKGRNDNTTFNTEDAERYIE
jgi:hypothetical protein